MNNNLLMYTDDKFDMIYTYIIYVRTRTLSENKKKSISGSEYRFFFFPYTNRNRCVENVLIKHINIYT